MNNLVKVNLLGRALSSSSRSLSSYCFGTTKIIAGHSPFSWVGAGCVRFVSSSSWKRLPRTGGVWTKLISGSRHGVAHRFSSSMPPTGGGSGTGDASVKAKIDGLISENNVIVFSKTTCPYCAKVIQKDFKQL